MKLAPWHVAPSGALYHWCPACEQLHVIPSEGWARSGTEERPAYTPSFGQHTKRGYCHYNITDGQIIFHGDGYHRRRDTVPMPDIPATALHKLGVTSEALSER